ncbi:putative ribonuclease H-like domain-containing protein [Tanacetum coccineum]
MWLKRTYIEKKAIDYDEVFAPVARIEAVRIFLAYASYMGFTVYQMDVKSAFLYGQIEEEVYVCKPPGFEDLDHPDKVYKVVKALYGLHQAPRSWYDTLATYLLSNGFQRGQIDQTLFIKSQKEHILLVQLYVDDIIFGSTKKELFDEFEKVMKDKFQMSFMGELTFFLGLQFNYSDVKSASTPTDLEKPLVQDRDTDDVDEHLYRSMIGSLMYLTASIPDIMFAVCACASFIIVFTEGSLRRHLKLADQDGITSIPTTEIFEQLALMGYHTDSDKLTFQNRIISSPSPTPSPSPEPTPIPTQPSPTQPSPTQLSPNQPSPNTTITNTNWNTTKLSDRIGVLEADLMKTKKTYSSAYTKLILKVKKLESQIKIGKSNEHKLGLVLSVADAIIRR